MKLLILILLSLPLMMQPKPKQRVEKLCLYQGKYWLYFRDFPLKKECHVKVGGVIDTTFKVRFTNFIIRIPQPHKEITRYVRVACEDDFKLTLWTNSTECRVSPLTYLNLPYGSY